MFHCGGRNTTWKSWESDCRKSFPQEKSLKLGEDRRRVKMCCPAGERKMMEGISIPTWQGLVFAFVRLEPAFTFIKLTLLKKDKWFLTCSSSMQAAWHPRAHMWPLGVFILWPIDADLRNHVFSDASTSGASFLGPCWQIMNSHHIFLWVRMKKDRKEGERLRCLTLRRQR